MPRTWCCLARPRSANAKCSPHCWTTTTTSSTQAGGLHADKGFAGTQFKQHTIARGLQLLRPDRKDETYDSTPCGETSQKPAPAAGVDCQSKKPADCDTSVQLEPPATGM